jgi:hypothetical protein
MRLGASWVQGFKRGDVSRHQAGMVPASLTPLDDARALAQLDQVLWVHARGFAIRAAGNQHVDGAGENLVVPFDRTTLNGSSLVIARKNPAEGLGAKG